MSEKVLTSNEQVAHLERCLQTVTESNDRLRAAFNSIRAKLAEYLERLLQGRTLPNRWVGEINDIVGAALSGDSSAPETSARLASDIRCRHAKYLTEPCVACEQLSSEGGERIVLLGEDGVLTRLTVESSEETSAPQECVHNLCASVSTLTIIDPYKAKCRVCFEFFDLPLEGASQKVTAEWSCGRCGARLPDRSAACPKGCDAQKASAQRGCELDTDGDGNCPIHPRGCPQNGKGDV